MTSKRHSIRASFAETPSTPNSCSVSCNISFKSKLATTVDSTLQSLSQVWEEAGYEEEEKQNLLGCFLAKMQQMCHDELKAEEKILEHAKIQLTSDFAQYCKYCLQLGRTQPTSESEMGEHISDMLAELERRTELIAKEVLERANILNSAVDEVFGLADALGENRPDPAEYSGPDGTPELADMRVSLLGGIRERLIAAKSARQQEMQTLVNQCTKYVSDMSISALAELQDVALTEDAAPEDVEAEAAGALMDDALVQLAVNTAPASIAAISTAYGGVHMRDVARLEQRLASLEREKTRRKTSLAATGVEIARLWTLLRIPAAERESFQSSFKMNLSSHTLTTGNTELARLRELRKASFAAVIAGLRADIVGLWCECDGAGAPTEQGEGSVDATLEAHRTDFPDYFTPVEELDDDAIEAHEAFCNGLKAYVESVYRPLLTKVARRESIVADRAALEILQQDPSRLTARGPSAREDRKREEVMTVRVRGLDKLTKDLRSAITTWEEKQTRQFYYGGARYLDMMTEQEDLYASTRDNARSARKRKDSTGVPANPPAKVMRKAGNASVSAKTTNVLPLSAKNLDQHMNNENMRNSGRGSSASSGSRDSGAGKQGRVSTMSSDTMCTSATEVKVRSSTCTISQDDYRTF